MMKGNIVINVVKALLTLAFAAAGIAKLMGVPMMVQTFDLVGVGQWFRYVTGLIELGSAILLWVPGMTAIAAGLLVCTMLGAITAHFTVLLPAEGAAASIPAFVLLALSLYTLSAHRDQLNRLLGRA